MLSGGGGEPYPYRLAGDLRLPRWPHGGGPRRPWPRTQQGRPARGRRPPSCGWRRCSRAVSRRPRGRRGRRRGRRPPARHHRRCGARRLPPGSSRDRPRGRRPRRRSLPEPAPRATSARVLSSRRLRGAHCRPGAHQRRRRLAGAGRGGGLYCARRSRRAPLGAPKLRRAGSLMCLALPMRITSIEGSLATIAAEGLQQRCQPGAGPAGGGGRLRAGARRLRDQPAGRGGGARDPGVCWPSWATSRPPTERPMTQADALRRLAKGLAAESASGPHVHGGLRHAHHGDRPLRAARAAARGHASGLRPGLPGVRDRDGRPRPRRGARRACPR